MWDIATLERDRHKERVERHGLDSILHVVRPSRSWEDTKLKSCSVHVSEDRGATHLLEPINAPAEVALPHMADECDRDSKAKASKAVGILADNFVIMGAAGERWSEMRADGWTLTEFEGALKHQWLTFSEKTLTRAVDLLRDWEAFAAGGEFEWFPPSVPMVRAFLLESAKRGTTTASADRARMKWL